MAEKDRDGREIIFTALSEMENIKNNIYGDILNYFSEKPEIDKIHVLCRGERKIIEEGKIKYYSGSLRQWFSFFRSIFSQTDGQKIKYILITDFFVGGMISLIYARRNKIPLFYRCGGPWKYELNSISRIMKVVVVSLTKPIVLKNCKKVIYNSNSIIQKRYKHNYEVVYNGVDTALSRPMDCAKLTEKLNLLYVGRIFYEEGLDFLFEAVKNDEKIHLSVVGEGELLEGYKLKYPQVKFYGMRKKEELPEIINQHDILVLPSLVESFPNVLLEAMACGKPVIATNVFGIPEMVTEGVNGFLVPPKDTKAIQKAIQFFIKNPEQIKIMGTDACRTVKERFEKQQQMEKLEKALFESC